MNPLLFITGDLVLDCHLYSASATSLLSERERIATYEEQTGGAHLPHRILTAAADARGARHDELLKKWRSEKALRAKAKKPPPPRPDDLADVRPSPLFDTQFAFDHKQLAAQSRAQQRSYGVWTDRPVRRGADARVWRTEGPAGYGAMPEAAQSKPQFSVNRPERVPLLTFIDDGGLTFRKATRAGHWPDFAPESPGHYLLKMSAPLCRGDLWTALRPVSARLIVVVPAAALRRTDVQISHRQSWEKCAEETVSALRQDPVARDLLTAAHVIINYGSEGALWVQSSEQTISSVQLFFDPARIEGDCELDFEGTAYGFQTCFAAGIAFHLMQNDGKAGEPHLSRFRDSKPMSAAIEAGISAGLAARRLLLELGHGPVGRKKPGFPLDAVAHAVASTVGGFVSVPVPMPGDKTAAGRNWAILEQAEPDQENGAPMIGLAQLTARYGVKAVSHLPSLKLGKLFTVDRSEIESFRTIEGLVRNYEAIKVQKRPLSIGVFGPPGAGKSFGVKALANAILGDKVPFLEFNLSQFKSPEELIGAFHRVRDAVLRGTTPVAFWDEFDSQEYKWLQYLLAPMQDGSFQEGQITHPIGKCIFIFAGGTSPTLETFGIAEPRSPSPEEIWGLSVDAKTDRYAVFREQLMRHRNFKLLKGPDFLSRLHGYVDVLGPNPGKLETGRDITWPLRRAVLLRGFVEAKETEELNIDPGLLYALLSVPTYAHGTRSFERLVLALAHGRESGRIHRAALPPVSSLSRETNADEFHRRMSQRDPFKNYPDLESLAAVKHQQFLSEAEKSRVKAEVERTPHTAWKVHPEIARIYEELDADAKASNRAAARRIADHLALINFVIVPLDADDDGSWKAPLVAALERCIELLAQAEHLGWWAERVASGWTYDATRDNSLKRHNLLVEWAKLSISDKNKDRSAVLAIPDLLETAGYKAVQVTAPE